MEAEQIRGGGIIEIETNFFDKEELHPNCTVQILTNSITGEQSVGWWENPGWIKVDYNNPKSLPEQDCDVLCVAYCERRILAYRGYHNGHHIWNSDYEQCEDLEVTYWMYQPAPPDEFE